MKILLVTQYFWPESFRVNDLAIEWKSRGHKVSVLTGLPNYPSGRLYDGYGWTSCGKSMYEGVTVYRVPLLVRGQAKPWQLALNYLSFVFFSCTLGPLLCREKYDLVFVFEPSPFTVGIPGVLFRYLNKAPMLFWVQDLWPESITATGALQSSILIKWIEKMVRFIYKRCDCVLIQSKGFEEPAIIAGAVPARIRYFPNWTEDLYKPVTRDENRPEAKDLPDGFRIMFAGNLGVAQSLETIVLAANKLKNRENIHWIIVGEGRCRDWFCQKIKEYLLEKIIHLIGQRRLESMPVYFSLSDVLLVTLRRDRIFALTIPSKIQSYLACGKPIIGALDGEGANIINASRAGYAVPAEDVDALADSVLKMYSKTDTERAQMGKYGRHYYEQHFDRERLFDMLEKIMTEVLEKGPCVS